jgi:hypothetical protein
LLYGAILFCLWRPNASHGDVLHRLDQILAFGMFEDLLMLLPCCGDWLRRASLSARQMAACGILLAAGTGFAHAEETTALYQAYWAGMPAGQIRLTLRDVPGAYRDEIGIRSEGFPALVTRFRATAVSEGRIVAEKLPDPEHFDAFYDLRKRRDRRLAMRFVGPGTTKIADRGPEDTSKKPPLAEEFRKNVVDPLSALTAIRQQLRRAGRPGGFAVPVYDGARRFDVNVRVLPKRSPTEAVLSLELTLRPIAGFKGETSDDGDPDDAPRPVSLTVSDDARLMPLSMSVSIFYLPLTVELKQWCNPGAVCGW